jgi:hypothetical protein
MRDEDLQPAKRQYVIGSDGRVRVLKAGTTVDPTSVVFSSLEQLAQVTESWPMGRILEIWNQLPGERKVTRFENRRIAVERLWKALQKNHSKKAKRRRGETASSRIIALLKASDTVTLKELMQATGWQAHSIRGFISRKLSREMGLEISSFRREGERVYGLASPSSQDAVASISGGDQ